MAGKFYYYDPSQGSKNGILVEMKMIEVSAEEDDPTETNPTENRVELIPSIPLDLGHLSCGNTTLTYDSSTKTGKVWMWTTDAATIRKIQAHKDFIKILQYNTK